MTRKSLWLFSAIFLLACVPNEETAAIREKDLGEAGVERNDSLDIAGILRYLANEHDRSLRGCRHALRVGMVQSQVFPGDLLRGVFHGSKLALVKVSFSAGQSFDVSLTDLWVFEENSLLYVRVRGDDQQGNLDLNIDRAEGVIESYLKDEYGGVLSTFDNENCEEMALSLPYVEEG